VTGALESDYYRYAMSSRYSSGAMAFHWSTAVLIVVVGQYVRRDGVLLRMWPGGR